VGAKTAAAAPPAPPIGLDGETFLPVAAGRVNAQSSDPGTGFALILDAARRKTNDAKLYQRAVSIAFAGPLWAMGHCKPHGPGGKHNPQSREANRNACCRS
jgi:hypothetical protein